MEYVPTSNTGATLAKSNLMEENKNETEENEKETEENKNETKENEKEIEKNKNEIEENKNESKENEKALLFTTLINHMSRRNSNDKLCFF